MKIVLIKDVKNLGCDGNIVDVKLGYARNYLIPEGFALEATDDVLKRLRERRKGEEVRKEREDKKGEEIIERVKERSFEIFVKAGDKGRLYGTITPQDIVDTLKEKEGIEIDRKKIEIPNPIKSVGEHTVFLKISKGKTCRITIDVKEKEG